MNRKQKKELRQRQSTRQLMGIVRVTPHGIVTDSGERVFFLIQPDNLSVLSPEVIRGRVRSLTMLLSTQPSLEILALDSRESFQRNKEYLTQKGNLDSILDDGMIRRFNDTECWFCESLDKMKAYMEQTVMCEGKPYRTADGQLCHYSKFNPEAHILLKLAPIRQENAWYRRTQEQPSSSSDEVMQAEREFFPLSIGYRGDMAFQNAEVIDVPKFLAGEIVSHKELTSSELWGVLFERTEAEMAAYMRGLDHLERDELIQSAAEISAMQVCRRGLMAERKKLTRRNVLFLLQVEKPLGMISEVWMEQQNAGEGNAFSRLLAELYKQKGNGYLIDDEQPETVKQMLESCPNNG